jgi:hypothetical protein
MGSGDRTCAVCGRTILAGEQVRGYVSPDGPRAVCELCVARAERLGWRLEGEDGGDGGAAHGSRSRRGLGGLFRRRGRRSRARPEPAPEPELEPGDEAALEAVGPDPAAPGRRPDGLRPDLVQASPFERAVVRFNASEAGRTVAGLSRTLGPPSVSVGASAGAPNEVRITVAWELSWYQWGVDLGDELRPVFQIDKGQEISQLDAAARQWNASTTEAGMLVLGTNGRRPAGAGAET